MKDFSLLTITWSPTHSNNIESQLLYKSFKIFNPEVDFIHKHFDTNDYIELMSEFHERFGIQSDYILFKIKLLIDLVRNIDSRYIIFCDANDVFCLNTIDHLPKVFDLENYVIIGYEKNEHPKKSLKDSWSGYVDYSDYDHRFFKYDNRHYIGGFFLNSGTVLAKRENYIRILEKLIDDVLSKNIKSFRGDQGVFTYYYNTFNKIDNLIKLDYSSLFSVNTILRWGDEYELTSRNISSKINGIKPCFIHDNGFTEGPKYCEFFRIRELLSLFDKI